MPDDVQPGPSPDPQSPAGVTPPGSPPVNADGLPGDRPAENIKAEFDRKLSGLQQTVESVAMAVAQMVSAQSQASQAAQAQAAYPAGVPTDAELLEAARAGNADAQLALNQRISQREIESRLSMEQQAQQAQGRILQIAQAYPAFQDPQSELFAATQREKQALINAGWHPRAWETLQRAMETAIVNNPQMVVPSSPEPREPGQPRMAGQAPRASGRPGPRGPAPGAQKLSPEAIAMAKRMGVKDPEKAMERFHKRQSEGRSQLSPLVETIVTRQEG